MGFRDRSRKQQVTLWHEAFQELVTERAPPGFDVLGEFLLSRRPRRADLLLLRRKHVERRDGDGRILRALWPRLAEAAIVEFKSPTRGFRPSELIRLMSYGAQYHAAYFPEVGGPAALSLVLVVPAVTQPLDAELALMGWRLAPLGSGYAAIHGAWYTTFVVSTDEVADAEHDDFLRIFGQRQVETQETRHWLEHWILERHTMQDPKQREGYDEMLHKLLSSLTPEQRLRGLKPEERLSGLKPEERLSGLKPEERLSGLKPEERLSGLEPEEQILALSDQVLRGLPEDYVRSLPKRVRDQIRKRLSTPK
jgi:hypothetical protein